MMLLLLWACATTNPDDAPSNPCEAPLSQADLCPATWTEAEELESPTPLPDTAEAFYRLGTCDPLDTLTHSSAFDPEYVCGYDATGALVGIRVEGSCEDGENQIYGTDPCPGR